MSNKTNDDTPTIKDILQRTDYKNTELMVSTYYPDTKEFGWTPLEQVIQNLIDRARLDERSIFINDENEGRNGKYIALLKQAVYHEHSFDFSSKKCSCGVNKVFLVEAQDDIKALEAKIKGGE